MTCQHEGCDCEEATVRRGGKQYCSEKCAKNENEEETEGRCPCGHSDCVAA